MKQYILFFFLLFALATGVPGQSSAQTTKRKSDVEMLIRRASKIKSSQISYAYISLNMIKQLLNPVLSEEPMLKEMFGNMKSLRRFFTTGPEGEKLLATVLEPFMQEDENVMGMELMTINREDGMMSVIYAGSDNILLINDSGECLSVVYVVGLTYNAFEQIFKGDVIDFDF